MNLAHMRLKSVAVLRALNLGDLLCAVPALRALRAAAPAARISLVGLPWAADFALRFSRYVDEFIEFPGYPGLPERSFGPSAVCAFLARMQRQRFELALQLHGSGGHVNDAVALFGAAKSAGFFEAGGPCPDPDSFMPYPEQGSETDRLLSLLGFLGAAPRGRKLEFPLGRQDLREWDGLRRAAGLETSRFACVHPGARWASRRWPAERFAAVADALAHEGLAVVLTGSASERPITAAVAAAMRAAPVDLAGRTTLGGLAALIGRSRLLVTNDTGASHLAAALGTPSVIVACGSDVERWRPHDRRRHRVLAANVDCRPCGYETCPIGHPCAADVSARRVTDAALEALRA